MGDKTHESNSSSDTIVRNTLAKSEKASPSRSLILHKCTMESSEAGRAPAIGYGYRAARQGDWSWGRVLRSKSVAVRELCLVRPDLGRRSGREAGAYNDTSDAPIDVVEGRSDEDGAPAGCRFVEA